MVRPLPGALTPRSAQRASIPRVPTEQITGLEAGDPVGQTILDFFDILNMDRQAFVLGQIGGFHPGCL